MTKTLGLVCHSCGSLVTDGICECSSCGIKKSTNNYIIFINSVPTTEIVSVYRDDTGQMVKYTPFIDLTLAKVLYHSEETHKRLVEEGVYGK